MKKSTMNLTEGNIAKQIIIFALPILLGQIFQNLYNSVDSIVVGKYVGKTALAAVTSSADISQLIIGFFTGLSTGSGVLFARYFGAKDSKNLHLSIHTAITFSIILGVIMAVVGIVISPYLLNLVDCPEDVYEEALQYLRVYLVGVLFTAMYNVASGVLRAVGDSRHPFYYLVIASLTNIVLDIVAVVVFHMGVIGVALATVISQLISVVLAIRNMMTTNDVHKLVIKDLHINGKLLREVLTLGLPAAIQSCLVSFSNLFVQRYINGFGSAAMAGTGAANKLDRYAGMVAQCLGLSVTTFISQNVGAGRYDRAFKGIRSVLVMGFIAVAVFGIPIYFFADTFMRLFSSDEDVIQYGVGMITVMMPVYYIQTLHQIYSNAVRGFGKSATVMIISVVGLIVCRQIFLAVSMGINRVIENVYWAYPVGWFCAFIMSFCYYLFTIKFPYKKKNGKKSTVNV